ncbi:MAG: phosphate uptake regulator PhoU [Nitrososphaerota archaeon]|nr:phosphate uptake regulator PhoU [Aigarchaeota archaeon]MDW8076295.1 phosphate uptake regulator PhoU [Nitrososphaerota archaeon]
MEQVYLRKIQMSGGSTLIVSLPKEWVKAVGLKKLDEVLMIPQPDDTLLVMPYKKGTPNEVCIEPSSQITADEIIRAYISYYLAGYDTIRIRFERPSPELTQRVKESIRRWLVGVEIVEESSMEILTMCLPIHANLPLKNAIERMGRIASAMQKESLMAFLEGDKSLAQEIVIRDDEVDRLYHFIVRQLNLAISNPLILASLGLSSRQDCLGYMLVAKIIERAADHASAIAESVSTSKLNNSNILEAIEKVGKLSNTLFEDALSALLKGDTRLANDVIFRAYDLVRKIEDIEVPLLYPKHNIPFAILVRSALSNIKRISEYSADISEVAVNISVAKPRVIIGSISP